MQAIICPRCQQKISLWNFIRAQTPFHLKCNHCKAKIKFDKYGKLLIIIASSIGIICGIAYHLLSLSFLHFLCLLLLAGTVFETITYQLILVKRINLVLKESDT